MTGTPRPYLLGDIKQVYADRAAYPNDWIFETTVGQFFLVSRRGLASWYSRKIVSRDSVLMHLYPVSPKRMSEIVLLAVAPESING